MNERSSLYIEGKYSDYVTALSEFHNNTANGQVIKIFVARSYTAELIQPVLDALLVLANFSPRWKWGDYNQYTQEILDPNSELYQFDPDLLLLLTRIEDLVPNFSDAFLQRPYSEWNIIFQDAAQHISSLLKTVSQNSHATVLFQNYALSYTSLGIFDAQILQSQSKLAIYLNEELTKIAHGSPNVIIWDFLRCCQLSGSANLQQNKLWYSSKIPFSQDGFAVLGRDLFRYIQAIFKPLIKCIIVDLDNTLWGGILGEDGVEGIQLGPDYPGNAYLDFQKQLLNLSHRGILLAIASKNNAEDVRSAMASHPFMVLKETDFAIQKINWRDKAETIAEIAEELSISVSDIVFLDDNPAECERVKSAYPDIQVIQVSQKPFEVPNSINKIDRLETVRLTKEDRLKSQQYVQQQQRINIKKEALDLNDFLKKLEMTVEISQVNEFSLPRAAQLTQKTNQYNLTTKRYTEADIQNLIKTGHVYTVSCRDKYGDNGIIGLTVLVERERTLFIDSFLLSCRVISRKIEVCMLSFIVQLAQTLDMKSVVGQYIKTAKNNPCATLYPSNGFLEIDDSRYEYDLGKGPILSPEYITQISPFN